MKTKILDATSKTPVNVGEKEKSLQDIFTKELEDEPDKDCIDFECLRSAMSKRRSKIKQTILDKYEPMEFSPVPGIPGLKSGNLYKSIDNYLYVEENADEHSITVRLVNMINWGSPELDPRLKNEFLI